MPSSKMTQFVQEYVFANTVKPTADRERTIHYFLVHNIIIKDTGELLVSKDGNVFSWDMRKREHMTSTCGVCASTTHSPYCLK